MWKLSALLATLIIVTGCSGTRSVPERSSYAEPRWYQDCAEAGSEGFLWRSREYVYSCGAGHSLYSQAAKEQMHAIALNNLARRIHSTVDSVTSLEFQEDQRQTRTTIVSRVEQVRLSDFVRADSGHFRYNGEHYTFVRLRMPLERFEQLVQEAQQN